jgi:hypothetical protein
VVALGLGFVELKRWMRGPVPRGRRVMRLIIRARESAAFVPCALCSATVTQGHGPQLARADDLAPVCRDCGRRHVPALAALLELGRVASAVGRVSAHDPNLGVPMESLLELERAAAEYFAAVTPERRR